jgi:hypothetical protein
MSSSQEVALPMPPDDLSAELANRRRWIRQRIKGLGRRRRIEVVRNGPPGVRDTQVVIGGTSVWTGGRQPG